MKKKLLLWLVALVSIFTPTIAMSAATRTWTPVGSSPSYDPGYPNNTYLELVEGRNEWYASSYGREYFKGGTRVEHSWAAVIADGRVSATYNDVYIESRYCSFYGACNTTGWNCWTDRPGGFWGAYSRHKENNSSTKWFELYGRW